MEVSLGWVTDVQGGLNYNTATHSPLSVKVQELGVLSLAEAILPAGDACGMTELTKDQ